MDTARLSPLILLLERRVLCNGLMLQPRPLALAFCALSLALPGSASAQNPEPRFIDYETARPILQAMSTSLPPALRTGQLDAVRWNQWLQTADASVRRRLLAGEEDTLTNLLRFGVTFTKEYRIDDEYFAQYGESSLVNSFAGRRAGDLVQALTAPANNRGFVEMRDLLLRQGYPLRTPAQRAAAKRYLLNNMARMRRDFLQARRQAASNRSEMFKDRGISLDSNLWPDYDLDVQLQRMAAQRSLRPHSVTRVAIVGPGLDFVNKQEGVDFYPPQTTQPFAVLDSLLRLGLADPTAIEIRTLDISSLVNAHLASVRQNAARGKPYTLQLLWFTAGRWSDPFRAQFTAFWQSLGSKIGEPVPPIPIPEATPGYATRALSVRPAMLQRVTPIDMNIVYQYLPLPPGQRFDLIIGTNIFLYYGAFEQMLARSNVAAMLKPGGYLLCNDKLAEGVPGLDLAMTTEIPMTSEPVIADSIFCYRRSNPQ